jgi:hypothetical protein
MEVIFKKFLPAEEKFSKRPAVFRFEIDDLPVREERTPTIL